MATSLNDIAIRMSVDAESVEAGFRQARNAAVDFTRYLQKQQDDQVRTYENSFARTALEFDNHIAAYKQMLDRQVAMQTANAAEMARIAEEKNIYGGLNKEQALLEAQRQQEAAYQALKDGYRAEEVSAFANARNREEIERLKQRNLDNARTSALSQQTADYEALKASYRREEIDALNNARNMEEIERLKARNADNARNVALAQKEADYQALKAGYRAEEAAARANAERLADIKKQSANTFMYNVKYGDPYDNPADRAARRTAMEARKKNDESVLKANNALQEEATNLVKKYLTAGERYIEQMKRLNALRQTYNITTGKMLVDDAQYLDLKTKITIATIRQQQSQSLFNKQRERGFGAVAGAASQASYAVEDFIQVLSMGGGLNMAMMSASNNLSMVARSMFGFSSTMGLVAGSVLPLAIIGTVSLIRYLSQEEKAVFSLTDYYRKLNDEMNRRQQVISQTNQFERERLDIMRQSSVEQVEAKEFDLRVRINEAIREQNRLQQEQANLNQQNRNLLLGTTNTNDFQNTINALKGMNADEAVKYREELQGIINLYDQLNEAIDAGDQKKILGLADQLNRYIDSATIMQSAARDTVAELAVLQERMQRILSPEDSEEFAKQLAELTNERADNEAAIAHAKEMQLDNEEMMLELQEKRNAEIRAQAILQQEAHKMQQDEMLFMLRATDAQKELFRIQKEQQQFAGAFPGFMGGGILGNAMEAAFAQQQEQDRIAFLIAQKDALLKQQESKLGQSPVQGSLVQNAFDAQADAFKQIFEAASKRPDPQVEKTNELLRKIQEAIQNGGVIKVVP